MAGVFAILVFLVVHVYMITTGLTVLAHTRAMITGWKQVEESARIEEWERAKRAA
jgi:thiosulfate reductase cytochrome b subunit